jgi:hypothetical protein
VKRNENSRKFPPKHRQLTPCSPTMDPATLDRVTNLVLGMLVNSEEKMKIYDRMLDKMGKWKTDIKA